MPVQVPPELAALIGGGDTRTLRAAAKQLGLSAKVVNATGKEKLVNLVLNRMNSMVQGADPVAALAEDAAPMARRVVDGGGEAMGAMLDAGHTPMLQPGATQRFNYTGSGAPKMDFGAEPAFRFDRAAGERIPANKAIMKWRPPAAGNTALLAPEEAAAARAAAASGGLSTEAAAAGGWLSKLKGLPIGKTLGALGLALTAYQVADYVYGKSAGTRKDERMSRLMFDSGADKYRDQAESLQTEGDLDQKLTGIGRNQGIAEGRAAQNVTSDLEQLQQLVNSRAELLGSMAESRPPSAMEMFARLSSR